MTLVDESVYIVWYSRKKRGELVDSIPWIILKQSYIWNITFNLYTYMMKNILMVLLFISGIIFTVSVLLMSPKAGLWAAIGGAGAGGDYGSKKSVEWGLKKAAIASSIIFVATCIAIPFVD